MAEGQETRQADLMARLTAGVVEQSPDGRVLIEAAYTLACRAHEGQLRKHGGPYLVHPLRVAVLLIEEFGVSNKESVATALLHDVLEDAPDRVSAHDIESMCGDAVLQMVLWLTSPTEQEIPDKSERNRVKAEKVNLAPREVWLIKLADRTDNLRDALNLGGEFGRCFRQRYCDETERYYLPMLRQLDNARVTQAFERSLRAVAERVVAEGGSPND